MNEQACKTPLVELLRAVPRDAVRELHGAAEIAKGWADGIERETREAPNG